MSEDVFLIALRLIAEVSGNRSQEDPYLDVAKLLSEAKGCARSGFCVPCRFVGVYNPAPTSKLQQHHIAGKVRGIPNLDHTITVCGQCHKFLTRRQLVWRFSSTDDSVRRSSYFFGWADVFDLFFQMSEVPYFENLAHRFRVEGHYVRNRLLERRQATAGEAAT